MKYGYARTLTDGQSVDAQVRWLTKAGCKKVFREVASGAKTDLAQLRRLLAALAPGEVVTVTRIDRLARSTFDLFAIVKQIVDAKAQFQSLAEPWADTGTQHTRRRATLDELARSYVGISTIRRATRAGISP
jgi:DNA invertase Pin-like site-specific DNA recombinase